MSAPQFTPGPWTAHSYVGHEENWFVRGAGNKSVCGQGSGRVTGANANLIAAAPELYEALAEARIHILDDSGLAKRIDAILAKARGDA